MAYTKTVWEDEVPVSTPVKYKLTDDTNGVLGSSVKIETVTSITAGTAINATNLNHAETGIYNAQVAADAAMAAAVAAQADADKGVLAYEWRDIPVPIQLNTSTPLTTTDKGYFRVPNAAQFVNATLISVAASCIDSSTSGTVTLMVKKNGVSMLSIDITLDVSETDTLTAAVAAAIGTTNTVTTGDKITVECTSAGTGVTFCQAELVFRPAEA